MGLAKPTTQSFSENEQLPIFFGGKPLPVFQALQESLSGKSNVAFVPAHSFSEIIDQLKVLKVGVVFYHAHTLAEVDRCIALIRSHHDEFKYNRIGIYIISDFRNVADFKHFSEISYLTWLPENVDKGNLNLALNKKINQFRSSARAAESVEDKKPKTTIKANIILIDEDKKPLKAKPKQSIQPEAKPPSNTPSKKSEKKSAESQSKSDPKKSQPKASNKAATKTLKEQGPNKEPLENLFEPVGKKEDQVKLLRECVNLGSNTLMYTPGQKDKFDVVISGFDEEKGLISLRARGDIPDSLSEQYLNKNAAALVFSSNLPRARVFFSTKLTRRLSPREFLAGAPSKMFEVQRRFHFRLPRNMNADAPIHFIGPDGQSVERELFDFSAGGLAFVINSNAEYTTGQWISNIQFTIDGRAITVKKGEIRHITPCFNPGAPEAYKVGVKFHGISARDSSYINIFVLKECWEYLTK